MKGIKNNDFIFRSRIKYSWGDDKQVKNNDEILIKKNIKYKLKARKIKKIE